MSTTLLLQYNCDATGCDKVIRISHWVALPLASMGRYALRRAGWVAVEKTSTPDSGTRRHFCSEHKDDACWTERPSPAGPRMAEEWRGRAQ